MKTMAEAVPDAGWVRAPGPDEQQEELAFMWLQRRHAVRAPNVSPAQLARDDESLDAGIDALRVAADAGWRSAESALASAEPEDFFVAGCLVEPIGGQRFDDLVERLQDAPDARAGLASALAWSSPQVALPRAEALLGSARPLNVELGLTVSALHRQDAGKALDAALASTSASVRARALRSVGEVAVRRLAPALAEGLADPKPSVRWHAAWSAVLLGDRGVALTRLQELAMRRDAVGTSALRAALPAVGAAAAHALLQQLPGAPGLQRVRIEGAGRSGNARYVPWLIDRMADPAVARIAFEAFVTICGPDVNAEQMESLPPEDFDDGPSDDADADDVELPEDIALPWPNVERVKAWWASHGDDFKADVAFFLGRPPSPDHCLDVLRAGLQRQRVQAANHLCLLAPGRPLFPTAAPAWRQQRLLREC